MSRHLCWRLYVWKLYNQIWCNWIFVYSVDCFITINITLQRGGHPRHPSSLLKLFPIINNYFNGYNMVKEDFNMWICLHHDCFFLIGTGRTEWTDSWLLRLGAGTVGGWFLAIIEKKFNLGHVCFIHGCSYANWTC